MSEPTLGERVVKIEVQTQTLIDAFDDYKADDKASKKATNERIDKLIESNEKTFNRLTLVGSIVMAVVFIIQFMPKLGEVLAMLAKAS